MGNKFETRLLGELCHEITVGFVGTMTNEYIENGIPFLRSKNIDEYDVKWDDMKYVSSEFHKKLSKSALKPGDVAIVRTGKPGTTCVIPNDLCESNCSDIVIARVNNALLCPHYLSYFMNAMAHGQVNAHIVGAVQQHFNVSSAKKLEIPLPSRVKQTQIVQILKTLDDKLKLNRQINQSLEQMAQTLFKSWFVDFDPVIDNALDAGFFEQDLAFSEELLRRVEARKAMREYDDFKPLPEDIRQLFPNAFEECAEPALGLGGWVPERWTVSPLNTIANIVYGKNLPKSKIVDEGYPVYGGNGIIGFYSDYLYIKPQVLISCRGAASGKVHWTKPFCFVTNNSLVIEEKNISSLYIYYSLLQQDLTNLTSGSAQPQITIANLNPVNLLLPKNEIISMFILHIQKVKINIEDRNTECKILTNLRDTLLPKLISGELSLDDIKIDTPEETLI